MAWYPDAVRKSLSKTSNRMPTPVRINLHTAVSNGSSLFNLFSQDGQAWSHFYVRKDGVVEQYRDTAYHARCDLDGNPDTISIETWDGYPGGYPGYWTTGSDVPPWTPAQLAAIEKLVRWILATHPTIPARLAKSNLKGPESHGLSWHRIGVVGYAKYTREQGGLIYSTSRGKVCPGDRRIAQIPGILAAATSTPAPTVSEEDDMPTAEEIADLTVQKLRASTVTANGRTAGLIDHLAASFVDDRTALSGIAAVSAQVKAVADKVGAAVDPAAIISGVVAGLLPEIRAAAVQASADEGLDDAQVQRIAEATAATLAKRLAA